MFLQEKYWRIPSTLHFETIRKRREIIIKAIHKELLIDTSEAAEVTANVDITEKEESSDDEDLFDNLRKMRDNNEIVTNKSVGTKSNEITRNRKRTRSDSDDDADNSRGKMQKIDEADESIANNDDDDDILSFAKRTLQHEELPDSEDIISNIPKLDSGKCKRPHGKLAIFSNIAFSIRKAMKVLVLFIESRKLWHYCLLLFKGLICRLVVVTDATVKYVVPCSLPVSYKVLKF